MTIDAGAYGADEWLEFAARLHPVVLHLPIGLLAAVFVLEAVSAFRASAAAPRRWVVSLFALAAVAAAGSGWLLGGGGDYAGELVEQHRLLGIAAAGAAFVAALLDLAGRGGWASTARRIVLVVCAGLVTLAGHRGGQLTHGRAFLSSTAPPALAPWLGPMEQTAVAPDDASIPAVPPDAASVLGVLRTQCFECHGPDKSKAGLRLDQTGGLATVVAPGDPLASTLFERVSLPRGHPDAMPPEGAGLGPEQLAVLEAWIAAGAPLGEVEATLAADRDATATRSEALEVARSATGARLGPAVPGGDDGQLVADWSNRGDAPGTAALAALGAIADRIVELRLAGLELEAGAVASLPHLPALERVHLERSSIADAEVAALVERAPALRYLNLHSTRVTAGALEHVASLDRLERLILWNTQVTAEDLAALAPSIAVTLDGTLPVDPFDARPPRRILAADASVGRIALLREIALGHPEVLWERDIEQLHDLQWLGPTTGEHGRVLFQDTWTRVLEVDTATDQVLWSYDAASAGDGPVEVHSFRRLDDGTTLIAESGRARLVIVDPEGAVVSTIPLVVDAPHVHHDTRLVRPTPAGTFLVAHERDGVVREYDAEGAVVWEYDVPLFDRERAAGHGFDGHGDQVFGALRLADGDTLVSTGNGSSLLRVRPNGSLRWHLGQDDLFGVRLAWTTGLQALSNGNFVLGNCHAGPDQPQAIELTPDGDVVWTFRDHDHFGDSLSNLAVVEAAP